MLITIKMLEANLGRYRNEPMRRMQTAEMSFLTAVTRHGMRRVIKAMKIVEKDLK
jgi:hypothetical protein